MKKQHARLTLYVGLCTCRGCTEGVFREPIPGQDDWRYRQAINTVYDYLGSDNGRRIQIGYFPLVPSEQQARQIIDYCESHISRSRNAVRLNHCMHGKIQFLRTVEFDGVAYKESLITAIEKCGYIPHDEQRERIWQIERELGFDKPPPNPRDMWRAALKIL